MHNQRFFSYLSLFTFMMIILVTANNFLLMFVGWEGVGVCSYLLVSFWFTRIAANQSSMSAFLTNRVGDCFLTIGMFAILWSFGNIDYSTVFSLAPYVSENIVTIIGICLLIGAMAKSSQIGLHVWLPLAMEGPTPVSALIHAATMVTAGVYLLMRTSPLIEYSSTVLILCLWIGAITTVFSSLIGLFQQDIKKVIAYSTMSQLGMMVIAVGLSSYNVALFHLINHAFYKGLLFLGAGAVIHSWADNQDFRKYGGLRPFLPLSYSVMLIASLSLVAFPFMTGFYSKDLILESVYGQFYFSSTVVYFIATMGAMFTTLYSVKVLYLTFLTNPNGPLINYKQVHEGDIFMSLPLIILAVFSIFFGFLTKDIFIGLGSNFFADNSLFIHPTHEIMLDTEFAVPTLFKLLPLVFTISLTVISLILPEFFYSRLVSFKFSVAGYNIFGFLNQRFLIELYYNKYITGVIFKLGGQTTRVLDKGSVELVGPFGLEKVLVNLSRNISSLDTGVITSYALYILIGLIFYMLMPYIWLIDSSLFLLIIFSLSVAINVGNSKISIFNKNYIINSYVNLPLQSSFFRSVFKRVRLAGVLSGLISMVFVVLFKYIYYGGIGENPLNITICLKLGTIFYFGKYLINITITEILEKLCLNFPIEELLFYLGWEDLLKFNFKHLLEILRLRINKQKMGMGGFIKSENINLDKPTNVLFCKGNHEKETIQINKDSSPHPNQWVDVISKEDKQSFPSIGPDGCPEKKEEMIKLEKEPPVVEGAVLNVPKNTGQYIDSVKHGVDVYNKELIPELEKVKQYFEDLDNNLQPSSENVEAFKKRQEIYLTQASPERDDSWEGPPVDYNNPKNVRLVAEQDLKVYKVTQARDEHWLKGFREAGYDPEADKNKSLFVELHRKLCRENREKFAQFDKDEALKKKAFVETWSEKQLDTKINVIKKQNEQIRKSYYEEKEKEKDFKPGDENI